MSFAPLVRLWILISAFASVAGWTLSAFGQLNRAGYLIAFAAFFIFLLLAHKALGLAPAGKSFHWQKIRRRFRRPLPLCFAALAVLIFIGGAIYSPSNYTGVTYHIPRVLQWLAHGQWCWIHTPVVRMNFSGVAWEWLATPLLLFTGSDRGLFLINYLGFLLLPGLVFSAFTRLGVRSRLAWQWMWLLPTGYNFLLQAGSICNDTFSAVFALAAIDFGCRAWNSRRTGDFYCSLLAIATMTGTKATSLPLVLPWLLLTTRVLPRLRLNWLATVGVAVVALIISYFPIGLMNKIYSGDWLGTTLEPIQLELHNPLIGLMGNAFQLLVANFLPPVFPLAGWWNAHLPLLLPQAFVESMNAHFDTGFFVVGEVPTEDLSGIGFGVCLALLATLINSFGVRGQFLPPPLGRIQPAGLRWGVMLAAWVSLTAYCMKSGMITAARLIAPYYALLIPSLLLGSAVTGIIRRQWWHVLTGTVMVLAFCVLIISPDRPLWPARTTLGRLHEQHPDQRLIERALKVYTVYSQRWDALASVRELLPPEVKAVGFIGTEDDSDMSLWRPIGSRRVEHFLLTDPPEQIRTQVQYVVVGGFNLARQGITLDAWLAHAGAELVATTNATLKIGEGPQPWYVVRFNPATEIRP